MMARGFKPVGWVAAVAGAALSCYMLSLNVAAERAELARIERQIVVAKQDIRTLHTELGTRGRMAQLEQWNAEVLALSAPKAAQFLESEIVLARFETRQPSLEERARVRVAAAELPEPALRRDEGPAPAPVLAAADYVVETPAPALETKPLVHRAAFVASVDQLALKKTMVLGRQVKPRQSHRSELKPESSRTVAVKVAAEKAASPSRKDEKPTRFAEARKSAAVGKAAGPKPAASSAGMLDASLIKELSAVSRAERTEDVPAKR